MNMVYLLGRINSAPYLVNDDSTEVPYVSHTLAVSTDRKDSEGNEIIEYVNIWLEGKLAEEFAKYSKVTNLVGLTGELRTDNDGDKFVYVKKFSVAVPNENEGD